MESQEMVTWTSGRFKQNVFQGDIEKYYRVCGVLFVLSVFFLGKVICIAFLSPQEKENININKNKVNQTSKMGTL